MTTQYHHNVAFNLESFIFSGPTKAEVIDFIATNTCCSPSLFQYRYAKRLKLWQATLRTMYFVVDTTNQLLFARNDRLNQKYSTLGINLETGEPANFYWINVADCCVRPELWPTDIKFMTPYSADQTARTLNKLYKIAYVGKPAMIPKIKVMTALELRDYRLELIMLQGGLTPA